jgi:hypothetical protein
VSQVAIFGDIGGHMGALDAGLRTLGVQPGALVLPDDLVVVQVGDLIHRGPHGNEIVAWVDRMMQANPGRWIQLIGNHEAEHIGGPTFTFCDCTQPTIHTLRSWVDAGMSVLASAAHVAGEAVLVTHAGLSPTWWGRMDRPSTPGEAAISLNERFADATVRPALLAAGSMLDEPNGQAGVVWAEASRELYGPWAGHHPPFGQVHGHSSAFDWDAGRWRAGTPRWIERATVVDVERRHSVLSISGRPFIGIDPGFEEDDPGRDITPLLAEAAAVVDGQVMGSPT